MTAEHTTLPAELLVRLSPFAGTTTRLAPLPFRTVVSVRAIPAARSSVSRALGLPALPTANDAAESPLGTVLWVRPDEWLVVTTAAARVALLPALGDAVAPDEGAVVDISASRVGVELSGPEARDVLASGCPLDLHPRAFPVGGCAQSVLGRAPLLLHLANAAPTWRLYTRPSFAAYVVDWLVDAMPG